LKDLEVLAVPIQEWMIFVATPTKVWTTACGEIQNLKLPSNCHQFTQKSPHSGQRSHKDRFPILLILLGVVGLRFLALCQVQITNRLLYH
jgi:hypothetical protein